MVSQYTTEDIPPELDALPVTAYGSISLTSAAGLFDNIAVFSNTTYHTSTPMNMEYYSQNYGLILYSIQLAASQTAANNDISFPGYICDRVQVFLDSAHQGTIYRPDASQSLNNLKTDAGSQPRLDLLVENMGRLNYGQAMTDKKGIINGVLWNGGLLQGGSNDWTVTSMGLTTAQMQALSYLSINESTPTNRATSGIISPYFYKGYLTLTDTPTDTYIHMNKWTKGYVWVNQKLLGRYWETMGPQVSFKLSSYDVIPTL